VAAEYCPFYGLCTTIKTISGNVITLADSAVESDLCEKLSAKTGGFTYLMLSVGVSFEEFKVSCVGGCLKINPLPETAFDSGDKVWFESCSQNNVAAVQACIEAEQESSSEGEGSDGEGFKIQGYTLQIDDDGNPCYVPDASPLAPTPRRVSTPTPR